jgi:aconitase B
MAVTAKAGRWFRAKLADAGVAVVAPSANIADAVAISGGESPTEAEYNALVTKINAIIAVLEAQGLAASS